MISEGVDANKIKVYASAAWDDDAVALDDAVCLLSNAFPHLEITDMRDLLHERNDSPNCLIKKSAEERIKASELFILIVGENTSSQDAGGCNGCIHNNGFGICKRISIYYKTDERSFVESECEAALANRSKLLVLYNGECVNRMKCPCVLRSAGEHSAIYKYSSGKREPDYASLKNAVESALAQVRIKPKKVFKYDTPPRF